MSELAGMRGWVYQTLKADATLTALIGGATNPRIFFGYAPEGATTPFIVVEYLTTPRDAQGVGAYRWCVSGDVRVKAIGKTASLKDLDTIVARLALLHKQSGTYLGWRMLAFTINNPWEMVEAVNGINYAHAGYDYRFMVQQDT